MGVDGAAFSVIAFVAHRQEAKQKYLNGSTIQHRFGCLLFFFLFYIEMKLCLQFLMKKMFSQVFFALLYLVVLVE